MATTTNFGWETPDDTDLVKDGAAAIRTALGGVDTSFVDLKGGTTGQILTKASGTDLDFTWSAAGMSNPMTTTGDIIYSSSGSTPARLGIGTTGQVLNVTGGVPAWTTPASPTNNYTLLNAGGTALTGAATITVSGISGKNNLFVSVAAASSANSSAYFSLRFNSDSGSNYDQAFIYTVNSAGTAYENEQRTDRAELGRIGNSSSDIMYAYVNIAGANATGVKPYQFNSYTSGATGNRSYTTTGFYKGTSAITSVSIISSTGDFDAGTIFVYGA